MAIELDTLGKEKETSPEVAPVEVPEKKIETPEVTPEAEPTPETPEDVEETVEEAHDAAEEAAVPAAQHVTAPPPPKDPVLRELEGVLSDGLGELYASLQESLKVTFKEKGEEAAGKIKMLFEAGKETAKKILDIVLDWLKIVPGINRFFLEQEAKIKTDKVMQYWQQRRATAELAV